MRDPKTSFVLLLALALLPQGCGGSSYPREAAHGASPDGEPARCDDVTACEAELRTREAELARVLPDADAAAPDLELSEQGSAGAPPDCAAAGGLRDRICELSRAICALAARNPDSAELAERCRASQASCTRAREDVARACE